jgi:hypothetical protein
MMSTNTGDEPEAVGDAPPVLGEGDGLSTALTAMASHEQFVDHGKPPLPPHMHGFAEDNVLFTVGSPPMSRVKAGSARHFTAIAVAGMNF